MRSKILACLIFVTIIFQHFQITKIGTYSLTLGFLTGTVAVVLACERLPLGRVTAVWSSLIGLSSLAAIVAYDVPISSKFVTTMLMFLVTTLFISTGTTGYRSETQGGIFWGAVRTALYVIVALSVGQAVTGSFNIQVLFNPFGDFQYGHQYNPHLEFVTIPRAHGFFLEPSYDAFVIGTLAVSLLCRPDRFKTTMVVALAGMAACQSATGLLLILGVALLVAIRSHPKISVPVICASALLLGFLGDYISSRLVDIGNVGSSGNYRLVAPLQVMGDVLSQHPLGMPFGSIYDVVSTYGLKMDGVEQTMSLDNGAYVIVYYFGWFGVLALCVLGLWAIRSVFSSRRVFVMHSFAWLTPPWLASSLLFSGGIMAPEFGLMTWLVLIGYNEAKKGVVQRETAFVGNNSYIR